MRKFLIISSALILAVLLGRYAYFHTSLYLDLRPGAPISSFTGTDGKTILVDRGGGPEPFEIRGVDMGVGKPGHFATEFAITEEEYLRWFGQIKAMGANTIRIYTINGPEFYEAFYQYNHNNPDPLYLLQGLWVNDYLQNSHMDAYDPAFLSPLLENARRTVDVIHGRRDLNYTYDSGSGSFRRDVSPWVLGYILGVEWEAMTVAYTDHMEAGAEPFQGSYFYAKEGASPFENVLARLGEETAAYEAGRYKEQRLIAFSNWPTTDPLSYGADVTKLFGKFAAVDAEHIGTTPAFRSGQFASYHIYPYHPDYFSYQEDLSPYVDETGAVNTYRAYLKALAEHHSMPVIISEFGIPSARGISHIDRLRGFDQGAMSEREQGEAIAVCYEDIMASGCAGSVIFTWQDEWFKRSWNTLHVVDLTQNVYWSDSQTVEQNFGLLAFDPGKEKSVCYVDGDDGEWVQEDLVCQDGGYALSMKYDEKYLYFLIRGDVEGGSVYLPIDTTPKSGSTRCAAPALTFGREADFLVVLDGAEHSRVLVQERYDSLRAAYGAQYLGVDPYVAPPAKDSPLFGPIRLILHLKRMLPSGTAVAYEDYETGRLTQGNGNPGSPEFNSLADFCYGEGFVELRLPWQLLNFSNPSDMMVHDDYYQHYGVENLPIGSLWAGAGDGGTPIAMGEAPLKGWGNKVTYHERLKDSYYIVKALWAGEGAAP